MKPQGIKNFKRKEEGYRKESRSESRSEESDDYSSSSYESDYDVISVDSKSTPSQKVTNSDRIFEERKSLNQSQRTIKPETPKNSQVREYKEPKFHPIQTESEKKREFEDIETVEKLKFTPVDEIKKRPEYSLGNYDSYYNYRYEKKWQDPRIQVLNKDFFLNKDCLDVGCNDGTLSIMIAIKYFPKNFVGMDIDYRLINKAIHNLKYFENQQKLIKPSTSQQKAPKVDPNQKKLTDLMERLKKLPKSFAINMGISLTSGHNDVEKNKLLAGSASTLMQDAIEEAEAEYDPLKKVLSEEQVKNLKDLEIKNRFPDNISFKVENFIQDLDSRDKFDTILCLSVTKWIHLNWGDCGVKRLFKKAYDSLKPGGHFILEPQEWKSYKKKKNITPEFKLTYKKIKLRPEYFPAYLKESIGFESYTKVLPDLNRIKSEGFKRPIYIFVKPE